MQINRIVFFLMWSCLYPVVTGQLSHGGSPLEVSEYLKSTIPVIEIPSLHPEQLMMDDTEKSTRLKSLYFAKNFDINANPENSGRWITHADGFRIWQLTIKSAGAYSLGLMFNRYKLNEGSRLFIFNRENGYVLGSFTHENNKESGILPVTHIPGDQLTIQLEVPSGMLNYGELNLSIISHAYRPVFPDDLSEDERFSLSGVCNVDINCAEGQAWQTSKRSVCKILIVLDSKTQLTRKCTGVLINNTLGDSDPLVITAAHCIGSQAEANSSVFIFNYESIYCDGPAGSQNNSISGATLLSTGDTLGDNANRDSLDFSLVRLSLSPPDSFNTYLAGWNWSGSQPASTVTIHHPNGDLKKISIDHDPPQTTYHKTDYYPEYVLYSHWRILAWDVGTTEPGSSGSPLFDPGQRIIGTLTGGEASCIASVNDYYTKFDYSWDYYPDSLRQLKYWLDPLNTGAGFLDGMDLVNHVTNPSVPSVKVYPNPGNDIYYIETGHLLTDKMLLQVYDLSGKLVCESVILPGQTGTFNLSGKPAGVYILRVILTGNVLTQKIIHQSYL